MTARLPRDRARPVDTRVGTVAPRVKCPSGLPRFAREDDAKEKARLSNRLRVAACAWCEGWHVVKRTMTAGAVP